MADVEMVLPVVGGRAAVARCPGHGENYPFEEDPEYEEETDVDMTKTEQNIKRGLEGKDDLGASVDKGAMQDIVASSASTAMIRLSPPPKNRTKRTRTTNKNPTTHTSKAPPPGRAPPETMSLFC